MNRVILICDQLCDARSLVHENDKLFEPARYGGETTARLVHRFGAGLATIAPGAEMILGTSPARRHDL